MVYVRSNREGIREASTRNHALGAVTIFTDAQAAIWRVTSDDPGPGQKYAIMARKHIATLRAKEPGVRIEIRWCPSHQGVEGNGVADEWAKQAADEPDAHGVEWLNFTDPHGIVRKRRRDPSPTSSATSRRKNGRHWVSRKLAKPSNRKYCSNAEHKPDPTVARANKRLVSRFYKLKTGHGLTSLDHATPSWWCQYKIQTREHLFKNCPKWKCQQKTLWATVLEEKPGSSRARPAGGTAPRSRSCSPMNGSVGFLATTDVGRTAGPPVAEGTASETSE